MVKKDILKNSLTWSGSLIDPAPKRKTEIVRMVFPAQAGLRPGINYLPWRFLARAILTIPDRIGTPFSVACLPLAKSCD